MNEQKITQSYLTLTPAYGRDYKSKASAEADFRTGKDFTLHQCVATTYCSIRDFAPGVKVNIRYNKMTKVAVITV